MRQTISGGADRRKMEFRGVGLPELDRVLVAYGSVERYDPVLRSHCRLVREAVVVPCLARRRPVSLC